MKKVLLYIVILILLVPTRLAAQGIRHSFFVSGGLSFPYNHNFYHTAGLNAGMEYLNMLDIANGIAFQIDFQRFNNKSKLRSTTITTLSAGLRHRFTESYYAQVSLGGNIYTSSSTSEDHFSGSAEIRTGFYIAAKKNSGYDLSLLLRQTTNRLGWLGLRVAVNLPLKNKKKQPSDREL